MHPVLEKLRAEHVNFARLLHRLGAELERSASGADPDYRLMEDAIAYIESYSDRIHHTREDEIYRLARERYPDRAQALDTLMDEHELLRASTLRAQRAVAAVIDGTFADRAAIEEQLREFMQRQYAHMSYEESDVFPQLQSLLSEADWQAVERRLPSGDDPLFGHQVQRDFEALFQRLVE